MRKDIYEFMKLQKQDGVKVNYAKVAEMFNCDYRTVKRYYENPPASSERKPIPSKLDGFKEIIQEKMKLSCSYYSIFKFICKKGYKGKYSIVANYCKKFKDEEEKKATIRFETIPGLQAQVDWKEEMTLYTKSGDAVKFNIFLMLLGYSRTKYIELTFDRSQETLEKAMIHGFQYFGGIPKEIIFDNMRTVVDQSRTMYKEAVVNEKFYQFSKDMGFEVWSCMAYRPQTKGKVEALARTTERLRPFNYEFELTSELNEIINTFRDELNAEESKATGAPPNELLKKEKEHLQNLPSKDILDTYLTTPLIRKVSKESMIVFNNRKYSLPVNYIGKSVEIKVENDILFILFNGVKISEFKITNKKFNYKEEDLREILKSDAMKFSSEDEIEKVAKHNLEIYDSLGE